MLLRPPSATRTYPRCPHTPLVRSDQDGDGEDGGLTVQPVVISGSDSNHVVGRSRTYTAQALLADGRVIDITALATFDTTDSAVATFDGNRLTALTPGAFDATASFAGKTAVKDLDRKSTRLNSSH